MTVAFRPRYQKEGAVFASSAEAHADKNSLRSPELEQQIADCYSQMLANGILAEPVYAEWDQATFTITMNKIVSSAEAYRSAVTFDEFECITTAEQAGWTFLGTTIT